MKPDTPRWTTYRRLLPALCALLVPLAVALVSCKPAVKAPTRCPALFGVPAQSPAVEKLPAPGKPQLSRQESDRRFRHHVGGWSGLHSAQAESSPGQCLICHEARFCIACHQEEVPATHHSAKWFQTHGLTAKKDSTECDLCHKEEFCLTCHGMDMPHSEDWPTSHVPVASKDDAICRKCHSASNCSDCHAKTKPKSHSASWEKDHGKIVIEEKPDCSTCHDSKTHCLACHGVDIPHPSGYLMNHKDKDASLEPGSKCFKCHEQNYCDVCHRLLKKQTEQN